MSVNKYRPHLVIIPEDEANEQIANGFIEELRDGVNVQLLPRAGGWLAAVDQLCQFEIPRLRRYPAGNVVLVVDFDDRTDRFEAIKSKVPGDLRERVFVIGSKSDPEELKRAFGSLSLEKIGANLAANCRDHVWNIWDHPLLIGNAEEVRRLSDAVWQILFA